MSDSTVKTNDTAAQKHGAARRFVIEGAWSGYTSSQQHVVHRIVYPSSRKKLRAWAEKTHAIYYTDGTALYLTVRDCKPRERVQQIRGYDKLIADCQFYGVNSVAELQAKRSEQRSTASEGSTNAQAE